MGHYSDGLAREKKLKLSFRHLHRPLLFRHSLIFLGLQGRRSIMPRILLPRDQCHTGKVQRLSHMRWAHRECKFRLGRTGGHQTIHPLCQRQILPQRPRRLLRPVQRPLRLQRLRLRVPVRLLQYPTRRLRCKLLLLNRYQYHHHHRSKHFNKHHHSHSFSLRIIYITRLR
jgi:hypothetical protein